MGILTHSEGCSLLPASAKNLNTINKLTQLFILCSVVKSASIILGTLLVVVVDYSIRGRDIGVFNRLEKVVAVLTIESLEIAFESVMLRVID